MSNVFVVDTNKQTLNPVHPGRARILLSSGQAAVFRRYPFTIILRRAVNKPPLDPLRIKLDPGSKTTGIAIVNDATGHVVWAAELTHRGQAIKKALDDRRAARRSRRKRHTRYRKPRFDNRRRCDGWLPPSLQSRIANIEIWVRRLIQLCPVASISQELVKFDLQQMDNPEICGKEYQQGTLSGCEVRQYLLEKWGRACAYCGATNGPLEIEHIQAKSRGGTNRISNLTLACEPCNKRKGTQDIQEFLAHKPDLLKKLLAQAKAPLKDASAVNMTRWALYERLKGFGLPIETGSGGLTRYNRTVRGLEKTHWLDAACVGKSTAAVLHIKGIKPLFIMATGHGNRQMCGVTEDGFPVRHRTRQKRFFGFQTGDLVKAVVPKGKKQGVHVGRVIVRAKGSFDLQTAHGRVQGIGYKYCQVVQHKEGYYYAYKEIKQGMRHPSPASRRGASWRGSL